jgi:hypothetical protein
MNIEEKIAVLKMAGYEVRYRPTSNHKHPWDWYNPSTSKESNSFFTTEIEAVDQAMEQVLEHTKRSNSLI